MLSEPASTETSTDSAFAEPRRLHPASIVLGVNVRQLLQVFVFPALASPAGIRAALVVLAIAGIVGLIVRVLTWLRFVYSFDGEVLRVDEGVLRRNHRVMHVDRIQQVEIDRSFLQRVFGLAALRVETAGTSVQVEAELRVVTEDEARGLRSALATSRTQVGGVPGQVVEDGVATERREILRVPLRHVVLASVTGARLLVFPAVLGGLFQFGGENVDDWIQAAIDQVVAAGVVEREVLADAPLLIGLAAVSVVVLSIVSAIVVGILRDANFCVLESDDDLHVSRGLLSTRDSVLPLRRIQLVQIDRNWLRRALGYAAVRVFSAGGSAGTDRRVTIPLLHDRDVDAAVADLSGGIGRLPELTPHPRPAMRRAIFRWFRGALLVVVAVWVVPVGWLEPLQLPVLLLLPVAVMLGVVEYRQLGHAMTDTSVVARRGALTVTTSLAPVAKIQAVTTSRSWFQRRLGLATVRSHVAGPGGDVEILDTGASRADELHAALAVHAAQPKASIRA
jgi:putative membrane protein